MHAENLQIGVLGLAVAQALRDGLFPAEDEIPALDTDEAIHALARHVALASDAPLSTVPGGRPRLAAWARDLTAQADLFRALRDHTAPQPAGDRAPLSPNSRRAGAHYLARCLMRLLRNGGELSEQDALALNIHDTMSRLREHVTVEDLDWVWAGAAHPSVTISGFHVGLLRDHAARADVQRRLRRMWRNAPPDLRIELLWRLLDDAELPPQWHATLFEFILENWPLFVAVTSRYIGGTDEFIVARMVDRLVDPTIPESRKWVYLCSAAAATNYPAAVADVLARGASSRDAFMRRVATTIAERLGPA